MWMCRVLFQTFMYVFKYCDLL